MIFLQILIVFISATVLALTIRAIWKGSDYIADSNFRPASISLFDANKTKKFGKYSKKLTPFAIAITFGWAGYSVTYDFLWFLGDIGFIDAEDGEWRSYRSYLSGVGGLLGLALAIWLTYVCEELSKLKEASQKNPTEK